MPRRDTRNEAGRNYYNNKSAKKKKAPGLCGLMALIPVVVVL
jgi:hypothetical protein